MKCLFENTHRVKNQKFRVTLDELSNKKARGIQLQLGKYIKKE